MITQVANGLWRGPRLVRANGDYERLKIIGIDVIINLESGIYDEFHRDTSDKTDPGTFGMKVIEFPCSDIFPPGLDKVLKIFWFINLVDKGAYIHCLHGEDRTGFICAAYRMREMGWTFDEAIYEMYCKGFHKFPYLWWVPFLKKYEYVK